jgi:hypothetical protein
MLAKLAKTESISITETKYHNSFIHTQNVS